ncbi:MAG: DciA family protein [Proteobacteria bacterium]|nr:DciA family protein [Pseudomonadota bacterium]
MRKIQKTRLPRAIGSLVGKSARAALVRRGFAQADILSNWLSIVGPNLADNSSPEKLNYSRKSNNEATLRVRVAPGWAPEFQHFEPLIIDRINSFFGYRAVAKLQLIQAPVSRSKPERVKQTTPLTEEQGQWIKEVTENIGDEDLKRRLTAIAESLVRSRNCD